MKRVLLFVAVLFAALSAGAQESLLDRVKAAIGRLSQRTSPFFAMLSTSALAGMVACNQSLTILLVHQLCRDLHTDPSDMALDLEDTAVVVAPLIPWSIACAVPLSAVGAPSAAALLACYLYLLPVWRLIKRKG